MMDEPQFFSRFVQAGPYKTHFVEWGDGIPVLMIHGGGPGACGEFGWSNNLRSIGQYGHAVAMDQIGFGLTDKPMGKEYSHMFLCEHVARFADAMCFDEFYIMGNSLGAYVAARYALDHPGRVKKLLMVSSGTIGTAMGLEMPVTTGFKSLLEYDGTRKGLGAFIAGVMKHPENISEEKLDKRFEYAQQPGVKEAQDSFLNFFRKRRLEDAQVRQWYDLQHRLPQLDIPIHFIWGRHDVFASPKMAEELMKMLPNAVFEWFEESGHLVQNDEPEHFNQVALKFFFGVDS